MGVKVFVSYSHIDEKHRKELEVHLASLQRRGIVSIWCDRRIIVGEDINNEVDENINDSKIILLMISPHFIASNYCYETEMSIALKRNSEGSAVVIPVIVEPCHWHDLPFGGLKATPTDGKPISMWTNINQALMIVTQDIEAVASNYVDISDRKVAEVSGKNIDPVRNLRSSNLRVKKEFSDLEKDDFISNAFRVVMALFSGSIEELAKRNPEIEGRYIPIDEVTFEATIYQGGRRKANCRVWLEGNSGNKTIKYSSNDSYSHGSYEEQLTMNNDGYDLFLKTEMGYSFGDDTNLSPIGGAEHYWDKLISQLQ